MFKFLIGFIIGVMVGVVGLATALISQDDTDINLKG